MADEDLYRREYAILGLLGVGAVPIIFAARQSALGLLAAAGFALLLMLLAPMDSLPRVRAYRSYLVIMFLLGVASFAVLRYAPDYNSFVALIYFIFSIVLMYRTGSALRAEWEARKVRRTVEPAEK